jgi:uncharacterized protein (DUF2141 family)
MKTALFLVTALLLAATARAAAPNGCVQVDVHNVRPQQGQLMVAAYGDADSFGKKPMVQLRLPAGDALTRFQLCGLSGEVVALTLFQDLDGDGKMNKNLLGVPTEPWGSSGTPGSFGPSWDTGRVPLDGQPIVVKLTP